MRIKQLTPDRENCPLALIFLGYAFTTECLSSVDFGNYDVSVVYDYQTLEFEDLMAWEKIQNSKREIFLIAWSMGVWAANRFASGLEFQKAVAINGTPFGIHENFGIPPETFQNSIEHFDFELFKKWCFLNDRAQAHFAFSDHPKIELQTLFKASKNVAQNRIRWTKAIVSKKDVVFPPKASSCFECPVQTILAPHFPFFKMNSLEDIFAI